MNAVTQETIRLFTNAMREEGTAIRLHSLAAAAPSNLRETLHVELVGRAEHTSTYLDELACQIALHNLDAIDWQTVSNNVRNAYEAACKHVLSDITRLPNDLTNAIDSSQTLQQAAVRHTAHLEDNDLITEDFDWQHLYDLYRAERPSA